MSKWAEQVNEIDLLVSNGHDKQAIQEAGGLLEGLLQEIYKQTVASLAAAAQKPVAAQAEKIGKNKAVTDFTLGQMVGLFLA